MPESLMLFIPTYNCEHQIARVLKQFTPEIQSRFTEIVVIDNRSTDKTLEKATEALQDITECAATIFQNTENYGLGGSHKVGFRYALKQGYDYCLVLHGDDQGHIADILPELDRGDHRRFACLLNARFMPGSRLEGYSLLRTAGNIVFNILFSIATFQRQWDLGSGLCCYSRNFLETGLFLKSSDDLTFCYTMLLQSTAHNVSRKFFPSRWREDDQLSNVKMVRQTLQLLELLYVYIFKRASFMRYGHGNPACDYTSRVVTSQSAKT